MQLRGARMVRGGEAGKQFDYVLPLTLLCLAAGFVYLVAVIDWFSRYVLSWAVSIPMDVAFCLEALDQALRQGQPEIFNTDQGAQFTSQAFTARLQKGGVWISMDGRGRALDNVFVERLWRSVKYEEVYVRDYHSLRDARQGLSRYFGFYNEARLHQALGYRTPAPCTVHEEKVPQMSSLARKRRGQREVPNLTYFSRQLVLTMGSTSEFLQRLEAKRAAQSQAARGETEQNQVEALAA